MRKVVLGMNVTLDGFMARPGGELDWMFPQLTDDFNESTAETLREIDTFLMGRTTYEAMAPHWQNTDDEIAAVMNAAEKFVFSTALTQLSWSNSRIASGDPGELLDTLKARRGRNIGIAGGSNFARQVAAAGKVDEYRLAIHPVAIGVGIRLFEHPSAFTLIHSQSFSGGIVVNTYARKPA